MAISTFRTTSTTTLAAEEFASIFFLTYASLRPALWRMDRDDSHPVGFSRKCSPVPALAEKRARASYARKPSP